MNGHDKLLLAHKQRDAASYDAIAAEFDFFTERISGSMATRMIELAQLEPTDHVLDIGTGTGLVALRAASLVGKGRVIGVDHSPGMLDEARDKAQRCGTGSAVKFRRMDAEHLDFSDRSFDAVLSLYALLHFPAPLVAMQEMHRVLRPGGRIVIGVGRGPSLFSLSAVVQGARRIAERVAAARGRLLRAPEFLYRLMRQHGLSERLTISQLADYRWRACCARLVSGTCVAIGSVAARNWMRMSSGACRSRLIVQLEFGFSKRRPKTLPHSSRISLRGAAK